MDKCKWYWSALKPEFYETSCGWMSTLKRPGGHKPTRCEKCGKPTRHAIGELAVSEESHELR